MRLLFIKLKRRLWAILLLSGIIIPSGLTFYFIQSQHRKTSREVTMKLISGLKKEQLTLIKINTKEAANHLSWIEEDEFNYNNQYYDIVYQESNADTTYFWCWKDNEDTELNEQKNHLIELALGNNPTHKENNNRIFKLLELLYAQKSNIHLNSNHCIENSNYLKKPSTSLYKSFLDSPPCPPPEINI